VDNLALILDTIFRRLDQLEANAGSHYKGVSAIDFTTTTLPHHGDYGFQTTNSEFQMNCNGTILQETLAAV
jgi:hypothetical protein